MTPTTPRTVKVVAAAVLVAVALAACGGGSTSSTTSSSASAGKADTAGATNATGASGSAPRATVVACLKRYGVTLPSTGARVGGTGASGRFAFGATGASGRRFPLGTTGASGPTGGARAGGGAFASDSKLAQALKKCGALAGPDRLGASGQSGALTARTRTELTRFVACMKNQGVKLPTPNLSGTGSVFANVDQTTATFKAAYTQCKDILIYLNHPATTGSTSATTTPS